MERSGPPDPQAPLLLGYTLNLFICGCATPWLFSWLGASASGERRSTRWLVIISAVRERAERLTLNSQFLLYLNGGFNVVEVVLHGSSQSRDFNSISATPWYDLFGQIVGCTVALLAQAFFARRSFLVRAARSWAC